QPTVGSKPGALERLYFRAHTASSLRMNASNVEGNSCGCDSFQLPRQRVEIRRVRVGDPDEVAEIRLILDHEVQGSDISRLAVDRNSISRNRHAIRHKLDRVAERRLDIALDDLVSPLA